MLRECAESAMYESQCGVIDAPNVKPLKELFALIWSSDMPMLTNLELRMAEV